MHYIFVLSILYIFRDISTARHVVLSFVFLLKLIVKLLELVGKSVREARDFEEQFDLVVFGSFISCSYVLSLRGSEGLMLNLATLKKH